MSLVRTQADPLMVEELVVLVDDQNNVIGTAPKNTVHTNNTPLHRAFSFFFLIIKSNYS